MGEENAIYIYGRTKTYLGKVSKEKVSKKYFTRVKKIWKSKLSTFNKTIAHNIFAVPVLINTYIQCTRLDYPRNQGHCH